MIPWRLVALTTISLTTIVVLLSCSAAPKEPDAAALEASAAARWPERFTEWLGDTGLLK